MRWNKRQKNKRWRIEGRTGREERIDGPGLLLFQQIRSDFFLPCVKHSEHRVCYEGPRVLPAADWLFGTSISGTSFLYLTAQLALFESYLSSLPNDIHLADVRLEFSLVYADPLLQELRFLYLPLRRRGKSGSLKALYREILSRIVPAEAGCRRYLSMAAWILETQPEGIGCLEAWLAVLAPSVLQYARERMNLRKREAAEEEQIRTLLPSWLQLLEAVEKEHASSQGLPGLDYFYPVSDRDRLFSEALFAPAAKGKRSDG